MFSEKAVEVSALNAVFGKVETVREHRTQTQGNL